MAPSTPPSDPAGRRPADHADTPFPPAGPARWPGAVSPPDSPGFEQSAKAWLFDLAPARWRYEEVLHKHPVELASMIRMQLEAELAAVQARLRTLHASLFADKPRPAEALDTSGVYVREQMWASAMLDQVKLIEEALVAACARAKRRRSAAGRPRSALPRPRTAAT